MSKESLNTSKLDTQLDLQESQSNKSKIKGESITKITSLNKDILGQNVSAGQVLEVGNKNPEILKRYLSGKYPNFEINFLNNKSAEMNIGLSDIMDSNVRKVKISGARNGKKYEMVGEREGLNGNFFDKNGKYLPVFNGFKVEVLESINKEDLRIMDNENKTKFKEVINSDKIKDFIKKYSRKETEKIVKKSIETGVDPYLMLSLRSTENGREGMDFGVKREGIDTFMGQLTMSSRILQKRLKEFEFSGKAIKNIKGNLALDFLQFFSSKYAPIGVSNDPNGLNMNHFGNLLSNYEKYSGIDYKSELNTEIVTQHETNNLYNQSNADIFVSTAKKHIGKKYVWGGGEKPSDNTTDCSGVLIMTMKELGLCEPTFDDKAENLIGQTITKDLFEVKKGDWVFFEDHKKGGKISHVAIATGPIKDGKIPIIDASQSKGRVAERVRKIDSSRYTFKVGTPRFFG